jgi:hypothetical protein
MSSPDHDEPDQQVMTERLAKDRRTVDTVTRSLTDVCISVDFVARCHRVFNDLSLGATIALLSLGCAHVCGAEATK